MRGSLSIGVNKCRRIGNNSKLALGFTKVKLLQPGVLLLGVQLPQLGGSNTIARLFQQCPSIKVLLLGEFRDLEVILEAIEQGARGGILGTLAPKDLLKAIHAIHEGDLWVGRKLLRPANRSSS